MMKNAQRLAKPVPKGSRVLGMHVGAAQDRDYPGAFAQAKAAGMQVVSLSFDWSGLETGPGAYKNDFPRIANVFYSAQRTTVHLVLRPINTNRKEFPTDLKDREMDDPAVIDRFCRLLDNLFGWNNDVYLRRYPTPPRNNQPFTDEDAQQHGFTFLRRDTFGNEVQYTTEQLTEHLLTQSNAVAVVEQGKETWEDIYRWLQEQLPQIFPAPVGTFLFGGNIWYLQRDESKT